MMSAPIYTVTAMLRAISSYLSAYGSLGCFELHCMWDWTTFFKEHIHEKFTGFDTSQYGSGMHEFMVRKDAQGEVRLWVRASSEASSWLPEGAGMPIFKSEPTGHPALKLAKLDHQWKRDVVETTVKSWFSVMSVLSSEAAAIREDWSRRFSSLPPPDGDVTKIPASQQLEWLDLPRRTPTTFKPPTPVDALSSGLENPLVNPMTFHGRTTADRDYELQQHQNAVLAHNARAVFQAQFLFVKGTSGDVELQRVANGLCIADAEAEDIVFSTAVMRHTPQEGWDGFWGYFSLKENPHYDKNNPKSGTKFVRQQNVRRGDIILYNVQVFETAAPPGAATKNVLRVDVVSLRALAACCSSQPAITEELPETHGGEAAVTGARRRRGGQGGGRGGRGGGRGGRGGGRGGQGGARRRRRRGHDEGGEAEGEEGGEDEGGEDGEDEGGEEGGEDGEDGEDGGEEDQEGGGEDGGEEDPPPPIPTGWKAVAFGELFSRVLLYTSFAARAPPQWHDMLILKELAANRRDKCTHDAHVRGEPPARSTRGVCLSEEWHKAGCWVGIVEEGAPSAAPPPAAAARKPAAKPAARKPAAAKRTRPGSVAAAPTAAAPTAAAQMGKRQRKRPEAFTDYRQEKR